MLRAILWTTSILLSVGVGFAASGPPRQPSPNPPLAEVPFTLYQNAIILPALINGRDRVQTAPRYRVGAARAGVDGGDAIGPPSQGSG
jgi:hypothetical protein